MSKEVLEAVVSEIEACGLNARVEHGGKHDRVYFPAKTGEQFYVVPVSGSCSRAPLNARSDVRRMLRASGFEANNIIELPRISMTGGAPVCNSVDIAGHFGKAHKDVLRSIDGLLVDVGADFTERNFTPSTYRDPSGRSLRCFDLTRDAFSLLVMGFTGSSALKWKLAYINAFNRMESELRRIAAASPDLLPRLEKVEGELAALIDLYVEPKTEPGFIFVKGYVRKKRGAA
jgi:Rha family phage regulatory protein